MGRLRTAFNEAKKAFLQAMTIMDPDEFTQLAIYDKGEVCIMKNPSDVFLPEVADNFFFVRSINGKPAGESSMGFTSYRLEDVDGEIKSITDPFTWKLIVACGFAECMEGDDMILRWVLKSGYPIPKEVFNILYEAYPETKLEDILYDVRRLAAAEWAYKHGADKHYSGLTRPLQLILAERRGPEAAKIFERLYGCSQQEYLEARKS